jgi:hypothetical protein
LLLEEWKTVSIVSTSDIDASGRDKAGKIEKCRLWTVRDVAEYLGVPVQTVYSAGQHERGEWPVTATDTVAGDGHPGEWPPAANPATGSAGATPTRPHPAWLGRRWSAAAMGPGR